MNHPPFLAAVDKKRNRIFVLAKPNLSAIRIEGEWQYCEPLSDEEIEKYDLITDIMTAQKLVKEARIALEIPE